MEDFGSFFNTRSNSVEFPHGLAIFSLPHVPVTSHFEDILQIQLRPEILQRDIEPFIDSRLKTHTFPATLKDEIRHSLKKRAQGMFLWVSLVLKDLLDLENSLDHIKQKLQKLPKDLYDVYSRILCQADKNGHDRNILFWLTMATRPLTRNELSTAIAMKAEPQSLKELRRRTPVDLQLRSRVISPMIVILGDRVSLIHQSVKDFLISVSGSKWFRTERGRNKEYCDGDGEIAGACLTLLGLYYHKELISLESKCICHREYSHRKYSHGGNLFSADGSENYA